MKITRRDITDALIHRANGNKDAEWEKVNKQRKNIAINKALNTLPRFSTYNEVVIMANKYLKGAQ